MEKPVTVLLIEPHRGCIDAFRDVVHLAISFGKCRCAVSIDTALDLLTNGNSFDIIFISHRFKRHETERFIASAKPLYEESTFIQLCERQYGDKALNASVFIQGMHGLLIEPLSVEALQSTAKLSRKIKQERHERRHLARLKFSIKHLVTDLDVRQQGH